MICDKCISMGRKWRPRDSVPRAESGSRQEQGSEAELLRMHRHSLFDTQLEVESYKTSVKTRTTDIRLIPCTPIRFLAELVDLEPVRAGWVELIAGCGTTRGHVGHERSSIVGPLHGTNEHASVGIDKALSTNLVNTITARPLDRKDASRASRHN